jgi:ABC-type multidrug transport system ATPase subunit
MSEDELKPKTSWVIGRAPECDLVVPEPAVSSRHCQLTHQADGFLLEDLGSTNGTYVNGAKIAPREPIHVPHGARVTLGGQTPMPWPVAPSGPVVATSPQPPAPPVSGRQITIGRSPDSDVQVDLPIIGWNHAVITEENGQYILEDRNSRNGTAIGEMSNRIQRAVLKPSDQVFLGSYKISAAQLLSLEEKVEIGEAAFQTVSFRGNSMEVGRDPKCDIPLDFPMVSWRHARLTRTPDGILVEDLGSRNGTYLNGVRVTGKVLARAGQEIGLGSVRFQLMENGQLAQRDYNGKVTIEAKEIVVNAPTGSDRLLDPVSLTVFPYELVALMGTAGAGKTTLLKALNGYTQPVRGTVNFCGRNLYRYYDLYRHMLGYVPQDDIVHPQLTVRQALYFSARLRTDQRDDEIEKNIKKVLQDLDMINFIDSEIGSPEKKGLSGGQRKRVNIGLELITDTPVLFLDEPTSGLASNDAESVVDLLKKLSKTGKTIIATIHQPSLKSYKQFDNLIMIAKDGKKPGLMVYFGPAYPDAIQFFNPPTVGPTGTAPIQNAELVPENLFTWVPKNKTPDMPPFAAPMRERFLSSRYQQEFVTNRSGKQPAASGKTGEEKPRRQFSMEQWLALIKRNVLVRLKDKTQTAVLLAQAPLFAILVALVNYPLHADNFGDIAQKLPIAHFLMVVAAIWFGCNNAARDIVGEWTIYKRERKVTLKLLPYVFSKFAVLLGLCIFQCGSMLAIVYLVCGLHSSFFSDFLILLISSMIGAGLGLSISALSKTTESAIAMLPLVLLPIIALGGGMRPIYMMPTAGQVLSAIIPSRWAFEANLLDEAKAKEWTTGQAGDYNCNITLPQAPGGGQPQMPPGMSIPTGSSVPSATTLPPGTNYSLDDLNPSLHIQGDAAENSIPAYLITFTDPFGKTHTCRASKDEQYPHYGPVYHAVIHRHSFNYSLAVLCAMLLVLVAGVIAILLKRDNDPQ